MATLLQIKLKGKGDFFIVLIGLFSYTHRLIIYVSIQNNWQPK